MIWTTDQLNAELYIMGSYGLRNKRSFGGGRDGGSQGSGTKPELFCFSAELRAEKERRLLNFLNRLGLTKRGRDT